MDTNLELNKPKTVEKLCFSDSEEEVSCPFLGECCECTTNTKIPKRTYSSEEIEAIEKVLKSIDEELLLHILERQIKRDFVHGQK